MRIIGYVEHPRLKITVFKMDNRLLVKLETGLYEQTYKFRPGEGVDMLQDVQQLLDPSFLAAVESGIQAMHHNRLSSLERRLGEARQEEWDDIV